MKLSLKDLREQAAQMRDQADDLAAIKIYIAVLKRDAADYETRLHLADALGRNNAIPQAVEIYQQTAKLCIHCGRPLAAIVVCRALEALGRPAEALIQELAQRYGHPQQEQAVETRRVTLQHQEAGVDLKEIKRECSIAELIDEAVAVGTDLQGLDRLPFKFVSIPLLSQLSPPKLIQVIQTMVVKRLPENFVIFRQGESGQTCYLLARGVISVLANKDDGRAVQVASLSDGAIFGEMSLITDTPRSATVQVVEEADVLEIGPAALAAIGDELSVIAKTLDTLAQKRWMNNLMRNSPVFKAFTETERLSLLKHFQAHELPQGMMLLERDKKAEGIYLIVRGEVGIIQREADGSSSIVSHLGPGCMVGMEAVLADQASEHKATTLKPTTVLFLTAESVVRLAEAIPEFAAAIKESAPPL